jgi:tRNA modification GTPase
MVAEFNDTIVSIATPHGVGAISIIRLSGAQALELALKVTKLKKGTLKPRYAHLKNLYNYHGKLIDKAIVIYFKAPNSFTGEDIV